MKNLKKSTLTFVFIMLGACMAMAQGSEKSKNQQSKTTMEPQVLNTYLIEREFEGAGQLTNEDLKNISKASCTVLNGMDQNDIQWLSSYIAENKIYCIYRSKNKALLKEHAEKGKFPCNSITLVSGEIGPYTAK